jgi:cytochrome subunit of sulfide dehydrogenase
LKPTGIRRLSCLSSVTLFALVAASHATGAEKLTPASLLAAGCAACHNTEGRSVGGIPVLAGLDREKVVLLLQGFQRGARTATVMHRHAKGYSDQENELLADYFSAQKR